MKIKVKLFDKTLPLPEIIEKGDWVDLRSSEYMHFDAPQADTLKSKTIDGVRTSYRNVNFDYQYIPLGVAMKIPKGFEAIIVPRSSTALKFGVIQANSIGVIDNSYCGDGDVWLMPAIAIREAEIKKGDRVCQFRIQLSQKATFWQKLKWFFSSKIEFEKVNYLDDTNRGGFGSTGVK